MKKRLTHGVSVLRVEHDGLPSENEIVAFGSQRDGDALSEEDESEDVAVL